ncbi:MAG: hypothetical protein EBR34_08710 [Sphingomonadaceae bacterium]|nr:hypothetical protein [Sphingomonadaceae bacterium]
MLDLEAPFRTRDPGEAAIRLDRLERQAETRDRFVAALDYDALSATEQHRLLADDEAVSEAIAFAHFYLIHLADVAAHAPDCRLAA